MQVAKWIADTKAMHRHGLTILELMVSLAIVSLVMALTLPALGSARESARRLQCVNHLRELGLGSQNHHSALNQLPIGWHHDLAKRSAFGWAVPLLPYLEQTNVYVDRRTSIDSQSNQSARQTSLEMMLCPSDIAEVSFFLFEEHDDNSSLPLPRLAGIAGSPAVLMELPTANYVGVFGTLDPDISIPAPRGNGAFEENIAHRFSDFQRGLSNTVLVGERTMAQVPSTWFGVILAGEDAAARLVGAALQGINNPQADECDFSSRHPGGANFLWADGHVSFVSAQIELTQYHTMTKLSD